MTTEQENTHKIDISEENLDIVQELFALSSFDLDIDEGLEVYYIMNDMFKKWDSMVERMFDFNTSIPIPLIDCICKYNSMNPVGFYTDDDGYLIVYGACRSCGNYMEMKIKTIKFPISYKPINFGVSGLSAKVKLVKKDTGMFI